MPEDPAVGWAVALQAKEGVESRVKLRQMPDDNLRNFRLLGILKSQR